MRAFLFNKQKKETTQLILVLFEISTGAIQRVRHSEKRVGDWRRSNKKDKVGKERSQKSDDTHPTCFYIYIFVTGYSVVSIDDY